MVNKIPKVIISSAGLLALTSTFLINNNIFAVERGSTNFNVNVKEALTVSITTPTEWASGDINNFLRNKVNVSVTTNNTSGFTASMTAKTTDTFLTNTSKNTYTLPTLASSSIRSSFPANFWGYSLDDTDAGNNSSTYRAMVASNATPITLLSSTTATSGSKDFYFGAKGNASLAAGTYTGTVVINVVSGVISSTNPSTPTNPAMPASSNEVAQYNPGPTGGSTNGTTTYTYRSSSGGSSSASPSETTTTEVSDGDNRGAYEGYTPPQGVMTNTLSSISNNSTLATGLALASTVAATSGMLLYIAARRDEDE